MSENPDGCPVCGRVGEDEFGEGFFECLTQDCRVRKYVAKNRGERYDG